MEMLFANDRRAPRHAVPVDCQVVREDDFAMLGDRGVDLSTCGMLVESESPAKLGDEVVVSLRIPGKESWIDVAGRVARIAEGRRESDTARAIGIAFEPLAEEQRYALESALCVYPTVSSSRPQRVDYAATAAAISLV